MILFLLYCLSCSFFPSPNSRAWWGGGGYCDSDWDEAIDREKLLAGPEPPLLFWAFLPSPWCGCPYVAWSYSMVVVQGIEVGLGFVVIFSYLIGDLCGVSLVFFYSRCGLCVLGCRVTLQRPFSLRGDHWLVKIWLGVGCFDNSFAHGLVPVFDRGLVSFLCPWCLFKGLRLFSSIASKVFPVGQLFVGGTS
ncbi:hypothetical protein SUGI_0653370 [Cryptomeria japonica]|nr:hypothetical protein SUGI_0653370 [Cryptomeria japonica]